MEETQSIVMKSTGRLVWAALPTGLHLVVLITHRDVTFVVRIGTKMIKMYYVLCSSSEVPVRMLYYFRVSLNAECIVEWSK